MSRLAEVLAVAIACAAVAASVGEAAEIVGFGAAGHSSTGAWTGNGTGYGGNEHYQSSPGNDATSTWSFSALPAGTWHVYTSWSAGNNRTQVANYHISDGLGDVTVDQRVDFRDLYADGYEWSFLGLATVADGALEVTASDPDTAYYLMADAVRISPVAEATSVLGQAMGYDILAADDGTWSGGYTRNPGGDSFLGDWSFSRNHADTCSWAFTGLADGYYRVSASYFTASWSADEVAYDLTDGGGTALVNQTLSTRDFDQAGTGWTDLAAEVLITDGDFAVTSRFVGGAAGDVMTADAIRLEYVRIPEPTTSALIILAGVALLRRRNP